MRQEGVKAVNIKSLSVKRNIKLPSQIGLIGVIIALSAVFTLLNPSFIMSDNILNIVRQSSVNIIMAMGVTFVMVADQLDLSIGGIACFAGMAVAVMMNAGVPIPVAVMISIGIGAVVGFINGFLSTKFGLPSMIVTIATMNICNGVASLLTGGTAVYGLPEDFSVLGRGYVGPIPFQVVLMAAIVIICAIVLAKTLFGRYAYAIGGNENVTRLAGVKVFRYQICYFIISGICSAIAGIILTSRLMTGQPGAASNSMVDILTAVVIGGAGVTAGSTGSVFGSLLGALLLTIVANGLTINGVNSFWQLIVTAIILLVVIIVRREKN